jgi:3-hydroxyisobutyrate dehydrogenase-like beta-hydroxyacid dehydrogenase
MNKPVVGMIGVGAMGAPMARRILAGGFPVVGYDINPQAKSSLKEMKGEALGSAAEVAKRADIILIVLVDDPQVREASKEIFANAKRGSVIAVMSSVTPDLCVDLAKEGAAKGLKVIDAAMVRGLQAAKDGKLLLMIGGDNEAVERCMPVFRCIAADTSHLGAAGAGQVGKMVNNMLLWSAVLANYEGIEFARKFGVDLGLLRESLKISSGDNWALRVWETIAAQPKWWDQKDLGVMLETAAQHRIEMPLTEELKRLMVPLRPEVAQKLFRK